MSTLSQEHFYLDKCQLVQPVHHTSEGHVKELFCRQFTVMESLQKNKHEHQVTDKLLPRPHTDLTSRNTKTPEPLHRTQHIEQNIQ